MKQFETKLTVRIYDTKLIESLNTIFRLNRNRYQTKNQLVVEILERGIKDKMKDFPPPDPPAASAAIPPTFMNNDELETMLKQLKEMLSEMYTFNKHNVEGLLAHLKMSERMSSCLYNILLAIATDEPITKLQVELGFMDDVPKRFVEFLNELLSSLVKGDDSSDSEDLTGENNF